MWPSGQVEYRGSSDVYVHDGPADPSGPREETSACASGRCDGSGRKEIRDMSDLVFISFPNEEQAEAVRDKLLGLQKGNCSPRPGERVAGSSG
jgi:hypothetical protein